ncbi:hypothetical protein ACFYWP_19655 [Actinacidiphila glaucinigra]|uniref:hypothetical protein n=1 Tax=Actinacidiphila glaucinigra TaxID=235986 RepID=UPI0036827397
MATLSPAQNRLADPAAWNSLPADLDIRPRPISFAEWLYRHLIGEDMTGRNRAFHPGLERMPRLPMPAGEHAGPGTAPTGMRTTNRADGGPRLISADVPSTRADLRPGRTGARVVRGRLRSRLSTTGPAEQQSMQ